MRRKFAFNVHHEHTRLYSVYKAIGQHLLIKKCCSSCPTPVFNKLNSVWLNAVTFTLLGSASLNYMGCTTPFTELARRMPWVAHKICVVFRCVYMIRRAGPLAEISARATGFFLSYIVGKSTRKVTILLQVSVKSKFLFGRMSPSPHSPPFPIPTIFLRKSLLTNVTAQDTGSLPKRL